MAVQGIGQEKKGYNMKVGQSMIDYGTQTPLRPIDYGWKDGGL